MRRQRFALPLLLAVLAGCSRLKDAVEDVRVVAKAVEARIGPVAKVTISGRHLLVLMQADSAARAAPATLPARGRRVAVAAWRAHPHPERLDRVSVGYSWSLGDYGVVKRTMTARAGTWTMAELAAASVVVDESTP
jgi:hypothetical protein